MVADLIPAGTDQDVPDVRRTQFTVGVDPAGVAHFTLYGLTVVSAVSTCAVVPIGKLS
jgi:hypothetical protein